MLRKGERLCRIAVLWTKLFDQRSLLLLLCTYKIRLRSDLINVEKKYKKINDLWRKNNSLEFTVLRHKITVLAPFCSYPVTDFLIPSHVHVILDVRTYSCCRTSHMFAIHCEHDRFCSQVQVAVHRMQMLLHMRHL